MNRELKCDGSQRKRAKLQDHAATFAEDEISFGCNLELLKVEMGKPKPRTDIQKDLMRRTFPNRWEAYVTRNEPATLLEYLSEFPLLKKAYYVSCIYELWVRATVIIV